MTKNLSAQLREQAALVDRPYADEIMREAADLIDEWDVLSLVQISRDNQRLRAALEKIAACDPLQRAYTARDIAVAALSGEPPSPAEPSEERVPSDLELIEAASELHQRLELDQLELDADAKRVLYGNLRRLYRRSEKSSEIGTGDCSGNHAPHVRCRYCPPERTNEKP